MSGTAESQVEQAHFHANPERAAELAEIGPPFSCEGWAAHVWPKLRIIAFGCSGSFATVLPKARELCPFPIVALFLRCTFR